MLPAPTAQQQAVIQAPLAPALVVAGAGSGKTETMANRVLWLLANEHVQAEPGARPHLHPQGGRRACWCASASASSSWPTAGLTPEDHDPFQAPTVSTYNSFANSIFRDNAILVGREGDGAVLGEAGAWQLARATVTRSRDDRLPEPRQEPRPGDQRRARAEPRDRREHRRSRRRCALFARALRRDRRAAAGRPGRLRRGRRHGVGASRALDVLVDLVGEYEAAKLTRSAVEYSDQVALALEDPAASSRSWRRSSATATASCFSTSTRTPRSCRPGCSPSCSPGIRSWRSATPTSRSMDGAAPRPRTSSSSARSSVRRAAPSRCRPAGGTGTRSSTRPTPSSRRCRSASRVPVEKLTPKRRRRPTCRSRCASRSTSRPRPTRSRAGSRRGFGPSARPSSARRHDRRLGRDAVPRAQDAAVLPARAARARREVPRARHRRAAGRAGDRRPGVDAVGAQRSGRRSRADPRAGRLALARRRARPARAQPAGVLAARPRPRPAGLRRRGEGADALQPDRGRGRLDRRRARLSRARAARGTPRSRTSASSGWSGCGMPASVVARLRARAVAVAARPGLAGRAGAAARHRGRRQRGPPARRRADGGAVRRDRRLPRAG